MADNALTLTDDKGNLFAPASRDQGKTNAAGGEIFVPIYGHVGATPQASPGYDTKLLAKAGACTLVNAQATNASNVAGYLVVIDAAAVPAVGAAITPLKQRRIGPSPDQVVDAEAEINTPLAITLGLVVLLTTSLTQYQPGALSGQLNASFY